MSLYLPVILGTARRGNHSADVARFVAARIAKRSDAQARVFDPRELPFGNLTAREWEMEPRPPAVRAFVDEMARADGFVLVFPEYNYGYPGTLKNVLDALWDEWNRKPFGLVSTGGMSGGLRAQEILRPVISGLGAIAVPAGVAVPNVQVAFDENGPVADPDRWATRVDRFLDEVVWYATALRRAREESPR